MESLGGPSDSRESAEGMIVSVLRRTIAIGTGHKYADRVVLLLVALFLSVTACRVHPGVNHLLFASKANSGVDVDTMPPSVEASLFGWSDVVQGPTFEDGKSAPVVVGFHRSRDAGDGWPYVGSVIATGPAAMAVAMMGADPKAEPPSDGQLSKLSNIELSQPPQVDGRDQQMFVAGEASPTWFSISEGFGVGFELHGPTSPLPQSTHVGYRRKEALIVPLGMSLAEGGDRSGAVLVHTPAVLNVTTLARIPDDDERRWGHCRCHKRLGRRRVRHKRVQLFATGNAATHLAKTAEIRRAMLEGFVADAECTCKTPNHCKESNPEEAVKPESP